MRVLRYALVAAVVAGLPLAWSHMDANGKGLEIYRASEGRFEVIVSVQPEKPVVGTMHFTIEPVDTETALPILNAEIEIVAQDPAGKPAYRVKALNPPFALQYYDANITIKSPGDWTLLVTVDRDGIGRATFAVPLLVGERPVGPSPAGTVVWLVVLGVLGGGSVYFWRKSRRLQQQA